MERFCEILPFRPSDLITTMTYVLKNKSCPCLIENSIKFFTFLNYSYSIANIDYRGTTQMTLKSLLIFLLFRLICISVEWTDQYPTARMLIYQKIGFWKAGKFRAITQRLHVIGWESGLAWLLPIIGKNFFSLESCSNFVHLKSMIVEYLFSYYFLIGFNVY
jgi:hypothetical protein